MLESKEVYSVGLPRVTIIIANHNYGRYLQGCLDSALSQTHPCNICIINDGCTDNTDQIMDDFLQGKEFELTKGPDYEVFHKVELTPTTFFSAIKLNNQVGPSYARNIGIHHFLQVSDYFAILDADDEYYPTKVEELLKGTLPNPKEVGVVYGDYDILNVETGNLVREFKKPYSKILLNQECIVHSGALISKKALELVREEDGGFYDIQLRCAEDYDLWLRISDLMMVNHVPKSLSLVRTHNNNSTNSVSKEIWNACWTRVQQKAIARHKKNG